MVRFIIPGQPVPKSRPRFTKTGRTYTDKKTKNYENMVATYAKTYLQRLEIPPLSSPIAVRLSFYLERGKTVKRELPSVKPDIDNLCKAVLDGLNGLAFEDDSLICQLEVRKMYRDTPKVIVEIEKCGTYSIG